VLTIQPIASATLVAVFQCSYTLSSSTVAVANTGGTVSVPYTTGATCSGTPSDPDSFVSATAAGGVLSVTLPANTGLARSTLVTLGNATLTVTQTAAPPIVATFSSNIPGSSFTVDGLPYALNSALKWQPGDSHVIAVPAQKLNGVVYLFQGWTSGTTGASPQTVIVPAQNVTFGSSLTPGNYLSPAAGPGGTITYTPGAVFGTLSYYMPSATVTLTATPNAGCTFFGWVGTSPSTSPTVTISMATNANMLAKFSCD
jgi:hypothetical protein